MNNENFYHGYVQVTHDKDVDNSGNSVSVHAHRVVINPYDVPPDDLPEGYTPKPKPVSLGSVIWQKLPVVLLYAGLCFFIVGMVWGCHHG